MLGMRGENGGVRQTMLFYSMTSKMNGYSNITKKSSRLTID